MQFSKQSNLSFYQNNTKSTTSENDVVQNTTKKNLEIYKTSDNYESKIDGILRKIKELKKSKRLTTLVSYNCSLLRRKKISFKKFNENAKRALKNKDIPLPKEEIKTPIKKELITRLEKAKTKFNIASALDELSFSLFNFTSHYKIFMDNMSKKELQNKKLKYLNMIVQVE